MTVRLIETVHKKRIFQDQTLIQYYLLLSKNQQEINKKNHTHPLSTRRATGN